MTVHSKRSHEGYLIVDHRAGLGNKPGGVVESATITCSHCCAVVVLNPDRSRARGFCPKCDHYVCDTCEAIRVAKGGECVPFAKIMDDVCEAAVRPQPL